MIVYHGIVIRSRFPRFVQHILLHRRMRRDDTSANNATRYGCSQKVTISMVIGSRRRSWSTYDKGMRKATRILGENNTYHWMSVTVDEGPYGKI